MNLSMWDHQAQSPNNWEAESDKHFIIWFKWLNKDQNSRSTLAQEAAAIWSIFFSTEHLQQNCTVKYYSAEIIFFTGICLVTISSAIYASSGSIIVFHRDAGLSVPLFQIVI